MIGERDKYGLDMEHVIKYESIVNIVDLCNKSTTKKKHRSDGCFTDRVSSRIYI